MNERQILKQVVGIDIGKDSFYSCYKILHSDGSRSIKGTKSFNNTSTGFKEFLDWCRKRNKTEDVRLLFVMEATGVYYEELAYYLFEQDQTLSVQLAQKVKYFAKSCNLKTKTDKVDSKMIAEFGIEKNLSGTDLWMPPSKAFKTLGDLCREHTSITQAQTSAKAQLHSQRVAHETYKEVLNLKKKQIEFYEKHIKLIVKKIKKLVDSDIALSEKIANIVSVQGLGFITVVKVVSETNGFILFRNIRQLVSYAGLDVIEKESGKYVGKTKISKKGNSRIRSVLYMPAMTASVYNSNLRCFYERINESSVVKRIGLIAVMRKLLILIYTLWNKNERYVIDYHEKKQCLELI